MSNTIPHIRLLQASVDTESESELRILVDGKFVKYLTIDPKLYEADDLCFEPTLVALLPPLPDGDWNQGHISRNTSDGHPHFAKVSKATLPGVTNVWHSLQIDFLEFHFGKKINSNVYEASCPQFNSTVIAKFARFPWEIPYLDTETSIYRHLEKHEIGPKFLGHLSEEGRVIGFIMEHITECRHATLEDLPLCQQELSKLHKSGIMHGDPNKHDFLIHDRKAILIDFGVSTWCSNAEALNDEYQSLPAELQDMSGRGG